jgi:hypothetical protein
MMFPTLLTQLLPNPRGWGIVTVLLIAVRGMKIPKLCYAVGGRGGFSHMMARAELLCQLTHPGLLDLGIVACDRGMCRFVVVRRSKRPIEKERR